MCKELEYFTEEEVKRAEENKEGLTGFKTKSLKLNLDNLDDRLLYMYLEDKSFTDVLRKALKIYKKHFDADVLLKEKLNEMSRAKQTVEIVPVQPTQETHYNQSNNTSQLQESDDVEDF